jgi:Protein of unknown function (DUF1573)
MRATFHAITLSLVLACGYVAGNYADFRGRTNHKTSDSSVKPTFESQSRIDLGVVLRGSKAWYAFWLANKDPRQQLEISRVETTCDCLTVKLTNQVIEPKKRELVRVCLDTTKEPDFAGALDVEIRFYDHTNNLCEQKIVTVEVSDLLERKE